MAASRAPATPVRIVMAKVGLDGHDRGVKVVARALRDAGYEVIYTGLRQTPEMVVDAALQEDARVIGLSFLSGAHMTLFPAVVEELRRRDAADIVVFGGGIIPEEDVAELKRIGVAELFGPGTPLQDIVDWLHRRFPEGEAS
jgi:methylmalonyl-CoA mutase C-terminal domain/subunit